MQKFPDNTAIVACTRDGEEGKCSGELGKDFVVWSQRNLPMLNTAKTKVLDLRWTPTSLQNGGGGGLQL